VEGEGYVRSLRYAVLAAMLATSTACVSIGQVERVSSAGARYASAVDDLLQVTTNVGVDADSLRLLDQMAGSEKVRKEIYESHRGVSASIEAMGRLRAHAKLLETYFNALNALARTDAPARAQNAVQGAAGAMNELGTQLRVSKLLSTPEQEALGQYTGLAITAVQRKLVVQELRRHAELIDQQLRIHAALTGALARKFAADRRTLATLGMQREVEEPYIHGKIRGHAKWIERRRHYLLQGNGLGAVAQASEVARKLREAWVALIERRFDELAFRDLLKDVEILASAADAARELD
jgi:hypothetical protein